MGHRVRSTGHVSSRWRSSWPSASITGGGGAGTELDTELGGTMLVTPESYHDLQEATTVFTSVLQNQLGDGEMGFWEIIGV